MHWQRWQVWKGNCRHARLCLFHCTISNYIRTPWHPEGAKICKANRYAATKFPHTHTPSHMNMKCLYRQMCIPTLLKGKQRQIARQADWRSKNMHDNAAKDKPTHWKEIHKYLKDTWSHTLHVVCWLHVQQCNDKIAAHPSTYVCENSYRQAYTCTSSQPGVCGKILLAAKPNSFLPQLYVAASMSST